jgi:hypothetical protein
MGTKPYVLLFPGYHCVSVSYPTMLNLETELRTRSTILSFVLYSYV